MTILQLIQKPQLRGAEMFATQLSNELTELGHEVMVVALFPGASELPLRVLLFGWIGLLESVGLIMRGGEL